MVFSNSGGRLTPSETDQRQRGSELYRPSSQTHLLELTSVVSFYVSAETSPGGKKSFLNTEGSTAAGTSRHVHRRSDVLSQEQQPNGPTASGASANTDSFKTKPRGQPARPNTQGHFPEVNLPCRRPPAPRPRSLRLPNRVEGDRHKRSGARHLIIRAHLQEAAAICGVRPPPPPLNGSLCEAD